jgi:hypothetical protein
MSGKSITNLLRKQPFEPFEIHLSGGEVHRVGHPELCWEAGSEVYVYYPETDYVALLSLLHVTSLEHPTNGKSKKKGGKS